MHFGFKNNVTAQTCLIAWVSSWSATINQGTLFGLTQTPNRTCDGRGKRVEGACLDPQRMR